MVEHTPDVLILEVGPAADATRGERRHRGGGYGNTFLAWTIRRSDRPGEAKILSVTGEQGPRYSPVAGLARDGLTNREIGSGARLPAPCRPRPAHPAEDRARVPVTITCFAETQFRQQRMSLTGRKPGGYPA